MPTQTLRNGPTGGWGAVLAAGLLVGITACETPAPEAPPPAPPPEPPVEAPEPEPVVVEPPKGAMVVRLHAASDADMPEGAVATVTLEGSASRHSAELRKGQRLVRLDGLETGRYDLRVAVDSRGVEIGAFSYFVDVAPQAVGDVTVQVDYLRADLVVEAVVESSSERRYTGMAVGTGGTCPGAAPNDKVPADIQLATDGERFEVTLEKFQQETLRLSGQAAGGTGPDLAEATCES